MNLNIFINVALSAAFGTAFIELLLKLFLSDWLQRRFYKFQIDNSDKRYCALQILEIINSKNYKKWSNGSDPIYDSAYFLSDRLISLGQDKQSKILDSYVSEQRLNKDLLDKLFQNSGDPNQTKLTTDFLNTHAKIDSLRLELVEIAKRLQK